MTHILKELGFKGYIIDQMSDGSKTITTSITNKKLIKLLYNEKFNNYSINSSKESKNLKEYHVN